MFDNAANDLRAAYLSTLEQIKARSNRAELPHTSLGSEHFFDWAVIENIYQGRGLPYLADEEVQLTGERHGGAILVEFLDVTPLSIIGSQLARLSSAGYIPIIAHPERYQQVWERPELVERLQDMGCVALLDSAALVGKYGQRPQESARLLLEQGVYHAACSDAHRPGDVRFVSDAMAWIRDQFDADELDLLFRIGPSHILNGRRPPSL